MSDTVEPPQAPEETIVLAAATTTETAASSTADVAVRTSEPPRLHPRQRLREILAARHVLVNLVRKEIKVKYKSSVLGVAWTMLNPILYLAVFSLVFTVVLRNPTPHFPVYLLSGLLAWNLFSTSLGLGARSVVDNANLVTKVYFPREILPLASVGTAMVDFVFQAIVLAGFMALAHAAVLGWNLLLLPLALVCLLVFTSALSLWVGALNVRYRDTQHLIALALLTWFWVTPVVYPSFAVFGRLSGRPFLQDLYLANPLADIVMGFQRALYGVVRPVVHSGGHVQHVGVLAPVSLGFLFLLLAAVLAGSLVLLGLAWRTFFHMSGDFAEEL